MPFYFSTTQNSNHHMAYDEFLADRIAQVLKDKHVAFVEKKMMGGLVYMVDDKMCVGVVKDRMMVRFDSENLAQVEKRIGYAPMDFTKKPLKGFAYLKPEGFDMDSDMEDWIQLALDFNPKAKRSKR